MSYDFPERRRARVLLQEWGFGPGAGLAVLSVMAWLARSRRGKRPEATVELISGCRTRVDLPSFMMSLGIRLDKLLQKTA